MTRLTNVLLFTFLGIVVVGCNEDYTPKPKGYVRIDLPEAEYVKIETACPYSFERSAFSDFVPDLRAQSDPCWFNIEYPQFKAKVHFSYKPIQGNLAEFLEDSRTLTNKHISKASNIEEAIVINDSAQVYGVFYTIEGMHAASPLQFHLTDSTNHFLRGALYFNVSPNNDSLAPVIDFLKQDMLHIIETFHWQS